MLSRGLMESDHLPAVLAHELGHLATPDGRLTAAINRLVLLPPRPPRRERTENEPTDDKPQIGLVFHDERILLTILGVRLFTWTVKKTLRFLNGGFGLWLTSPLWGAYWRGREYKADAYAAKLGQADDLADFLENHALIHDHPVPYIWLTEHTHPPVELRIDKLRDSVMREVVGRSEPVKETPTGPPTAGPAGLPLTEP
jgi:Zn-dependent protease with chaperone function